MCISMETCVRRDALRLVSCACVNKAACSVQAAKLDQPQIVRTTRHSHTYTQTHSL
jgi:hypothetical protein